MKNKYERLSKEERKDACINFRNSEDNKNRVYEKLTRLKVICVIGFILFIVLTIIDLIEKNTPIWMYIYDGVVLALVVFVYVKAGSLRNDLVNSYLINKDNKKKSKKKK